ncbi:type VI secretion system tube protein IglC [Facilibium subflavum]|uniref:type VI secretion system tube protein IglC n=1 Tax=Facilibium subflavum TaxID=2219058 RepID=UPI000E65915E|nr:type VI secretion system tube protein IglC [Facilibium subflavum]
MSSIEPKVPRSVVLDAKPLSFRLGEADFAGSHSRPRVFFDSLTILGKDVGKYLFAIDGGQDLNEVTSPTAAANLIEFHLSGPQMKANLEITVGLPLSPSLKEELDSLISSVKKSEAQDVTIKFGATNQKQEYKNDDQWGKIVDLSELVVCPIENTGFNIDMQQYGFLGGSTASADYYILTITGIMIDKANFSKAALDVEHSNSTDKGQYGLLSIDESAASAA